MVKMITFWGGQTDLPCQPKYIFNHIVFLVSWNNGLWARIILDERAHVPASFNTSFYGTSIDDVMQQAEKALKSIPAHKDLQMIVNDVK